MNFVNVDLRLSARCWQDRKEFGNKRYGLSFGDRKVGVFPILDFINGGTDFPKAQITQLNERAAAIGTIPKILLADSILQISFTSETPSY